MPFIGLHSPFASQEFACCKGGICSLQTPQGEGGLNPVLPPRGRGPWPWWPRLKGGRIALLHCGRINAVQVFRMKVKCHLPALSSVSQCYTGSLDASFILLLTVTHIMCKKSDITCLWMVPVHSKSIPRSENKGWFTAQSMRVSDSKAGAGNNNPFPDTSHLCNCILSSHYTQLCKHSLIHPWARLFAWGSQ